MSVEKLKQKIEASIHVRGKDLFAACEDQGDLYAAIDLLADKLDRQIVRHKEVKHKNRHSSALKHQAAE